MKGLESRRRTSYLQYGQTCEGGTGLPTDRLFTGQLLDSSSGLYVMGARMYDPTIGRFLSADTIVPDPKNPQALNWYTLQSTIRSNSQTLPATLAF